MRCRSVFRALGFLAMGVLLVFTLACIDRPMRNAPLAPVIIGDLSLPQSAERDVDLLFVIDNSGSMEDEIAMLQQQFPILMMELRRMVGGLPNVHIGVTSTDLGTGMFSITYCEEAGGDQGNLLTGSCQNPVGSSFIVDVEPAACEVVKQESGACSAHQCTQANCAHEPNTTLEIDAATGCPRCRNYAGQSLEDVFYCIANLGIEGCGFEQPLEAMYKALDGNPQNHGFVRENAFLAVVFITDEDDCSASNPQLFDTSQDDLVSTLGPLTSFRCFEFGVTCDINQRTHQGLRQGCVPREDPNALLHPVSRYTGFLAELKDPQMLVVAAIAGPVNDQSVTVGLDGYSRPEVQYSCSTERGGAVPGIRLQAFVEAMQQQDTDMAWAYTSICSPTFSTALAGIGERLRARMEFQCFPRPLKGCSDIGAEFDTPVDSLSCNDVCLPTCKVIDVYERGTPNEARAIVTPCLEVCPAGLCPGNTDRNAAYAQGHPPKRDASLPVPGCWHIGYHEQCAASNYAELVISRRADPPPRSFAEVGCLQIPEREQLCNDGLDNDEDCLTDLEDPDCLTD